MTSSSRVDPEAPVPAATGPAATDPRPAGGVPAFACGPVLAVALAVLLAHLAAATRPGRWYDEALMLALGRSHLDWGAVDQPPLVPLLARIADTLAPGSQLVLELPAIAATVGSVVLAALVARELGADARAQTIAALAQATSRWAALVGHWLTPYSLEPVLWLAIGWLLLRWMRTRDDRLLLALGVVAGIGAQTKFQVMLLCVVLACSLLVLGPRDVLRRPLLWVGAVVAVLIASPALLWQAANGWPQVALARNVADQAADYGGRPAIAFSLVALAGVLGAALTVAGFVAVWVVPELRTYRFLALAFAVLFVLFVVPPGRPGYLAGFHGLLVAVGVVWLQRRREAGHTRWRWVVWPAALLAVVLAVTNLRASLGQASPVVADSVVATTARTWSALPPAQRERTALVTDTFMYAAYLDTAPRELGLPPAASSSVSYGYLDPPPEDRDAVLLVSSGRPEPITIDGLRPHFRDMRLLTSVVPYPSPSIFGGGKPTNLWLLSGRLTPWADFWESLRTVG